MWFGKLVVVIEEKDVLAALDVWNSSRGGARDAHGGHGVVAEGRQPLGQHQLVVRAPAISST